MPNRAIGARRWAWPRRVAGRFAVIVLVSALAGCTSAETSAPSEVPEYWTNQISQVLRAADVGDFEKSVLADFQVTDAEYQEAQSRFVRCMADLGWAVGDMDGGGGYEVTSAEGLPYEDHALSEATAQCPMYDMISSFYVGMRENPSGQTAGERVRTCFDAKGVPDGAGLSPDRFARMLQDPGYCPSSATAMLCMVDPTGSQGLTEGFVAGLRAHHCDNASAEPIR